MANKIERKFVRDVSKFYQGRMIRIDFWDVFLN